MGADMRSGVVNGRGERGSLHYLIKLPQAGGSTWANLWVNDPSCERPRVVIGGDDFRIALHGQEYARPAEGLVFGVMDTAIRALLYRGFDVLVDETSTTEATLLRYYLMDFDAVPHVLEADEETCLARAAASNRPYLFEPIRLMARQREELLRDWPAAIQRVKDKIKWRYPNDVVGRAS